LAWAARKAIFAGKEVKDRVPAASRDGSGVRAMAPLPERRVPTADDMTPPLQQLSSEPIAHEGLDGRLLRAVGRAVAELRRGEALLLNDGGECWALLQAAEGVDGAGLARLRRLGGAGRGDGGPLLLLTRQRAGRLGLAAPLGPSLALRDDAVVALGTDGLRAESLAELADPSARRPTALPVRAGQGAGQGAGPDLLPAPLLAAEAIALVKLARLLPAVLMVPLDAADAEALARHHDLLSVSAPAVEAYGLSAARSLEQVAAARVPLAAAEDTRIVAFRPADGGIEHLAIVIGEPEPGSSVLTRLHSECFTGDLLGSLRCDCGDQLRGAIEAIAAEGAGILLYLAQEGRGIGLVNKLRAYSLQDLGADTFEANQQLGFDADERVYQPAAEMLRLLGFQDVRLLTNNPDKVAGLQRCGIAVAERVPHRFPSNGHNAYYLATKAERGHLF
jgi:GTP cyclohydrolase II